MKRIILPGGTRLSNERRVAASGGGPKTLDIEARTVDAVLSKGSSVNRAFGVERLRISPKAVNTDRVTAGIAPVLDSHQQVGINNSVGRLAAVWFEAGALMGRMLFHETAAGQTAFEMIARREVNSVSIGYDVSDWEITEDGRVIDPEVERLRADADYVFTAVRWRLFEVSLVNCPADESALIRSYGGGSDCSHVEAARARMMARYRMMTRARMLDRMRGR
ncbi:HK97 family phage prohead protease [Bradyrhizobium elkanii]|uniref:HK97 family phage prohead protease n=1 Tax=Bradyrhizobium elkanii TaxID=29448 RepID=UPI003D1F0439